LYLKAPHRNLAPIPSAPIDSYSTSTNLQTMVTELLQKMCRTASGSSRQSASSTESTTTTPPQPKGKGHPSRVAPPRPAGQTAQQQQQRPASLHSNSSQRQGQQHDQKMVRGRIPAVTSTARTTAPETEKERKLRQRYPSNFRRGPY
jgi:hypothetical protein